MYRRRVWWILGKRAQTGCLLSTGEGPPTLDYLGFTHYWGLSRKGKVRLKRKTSKKRLRRSLVAINQWLRSNRNKMKLPELWQIIAVKMRGHINYFGVTDNGWSVRRFYKGAQRCLFKWLNRRSQRRSFIWESFNRYEKRFPLPRPQIRVQLNPVWQKAG